MRLEPRTRVKAPVEPWVALISGSGLPSVGASSTAFQTASAPGRVSPSPIPPPAGSQGSYFQSFLWKWPSIHLARPVSFPLHISAFTRGILSMVERWRVAVFLTHTKTNFKMFKSFTVALQSGQGLLHNWWDPVNLQHTRGLRQVQMDSRVDWNHRDPWNSRSGHRCCSNPLCTAWNDANIFRRIPAKTDWFLFPSINNSYFEMLFKSSIVNLNFSWVLSPQLSCGRAAGTTHHMDL